MNSNYHIEGTIDFYINDQFYRSYKFENMYEREEIIASFLNQTKHIVRKVTPYYIISIKEETFRKLWPHARKKQL